MTVTTIGDPRLIVLWRQGKTVQSRTVKIGGDVSARLKEFAVDCAEGINDNAPEYDPDAPPEGDPQRTASRGEAFDTGLLAELDKGSSQDSASAEDLHRALVCWAVVLGSGDTQTVFVHKNNPVQLAHKPLVAGLLDATLTVVSEPLFAFDPNFDLVITAEKLHILDPKDFEGLFRDSDAVLAKAEEWATTLTGALPSTDGSLDELMQTLKSNGVIRRKVLSILRRPYFAELTPDTVRSRLKLHNLDEATYFPDGKLNFTAATIVTLVRFLNEDLFRGDFSDEQFAASGKQRLGSSPDSV
jgi:Domain of unknown function (DUF4868)